MLTCCPSCGAWFRVRGAQLSAAHGLVTCGVCETVFDALVTLVDEAGERAARSPDMAARVERDADVVGPPVSPVESIPAASRAVPGPPTAAAPPTDAAPTIAAAPATSVPEVLRGELAALARQSARRPWATAGWWLAALLLGTAALVQIALLEHARLRAAWPAAAPALATLCAHLPCVRSAAPVAPRRVELLARDIREHPQYEDALLVNATLINAGPDATPYPVLELVLHGARGEILGARRFDPAEYLDDSIDRATGMPPAQPIYIVLELGGDAVAATSFEFSFL